MEEERAKFEEAGYSLVGLSYDSVEKLEQFGKKRSIGFPLLSDSDSEVIKAFGILDTKHKEGSFAYGIAKPTIYIINKDKTIRSVVAEKGYKVRPPIDNVLGQL